MYSCSWSRFDLSPAGAWVTAASAAHLHPGLGLFRHQWIEIYTKGTDSEPPFSVLGWEPELELDTRHLSLVTSVSSRFTPPAARAAGLGFASRATYATPHKRTVGYPTQRTSHCHCSERMTGRKYLVLCAVITHPTRTFLRHESPGVIRSRCNPRSPDPRCSTCVECE